METASKLDRLKHGFNNLVSSADYISMYDFMNWLDQKLSEYKHTGHLLNRELQVTSGELANKLAPYQLPIFSRALPTINKAATSSLNSFPILNYSLNGAKLAPYVSSPTATVPPATQLNQFKDVEYSTTLNLCKDNQKHLELMNKPYEPYNPLVIDLPPSSSLTPSPDKLTCRTPDLQPSSCSDPSSSPPQDNSSNSPISIVSSHSSTSNPVPPPFRTPPSGATAVTNGQSQSPKSSNQNSPKDDSRKKAKSSPIGADCPHCGKHLRYRSSFHRHMRIHAGLYSHECSTCDRKFTRREHYQRHNCQRKSIKRSVLPIVQDMSLSRGHAAGNSSSGSDSVSRTIDAVAKSISFDSSDNHSGGGGGGAGSSGSVSRRKKSAPRRIVEAEKVFSDSDSDVIVQTSPDNTHRNGVQNSTEISPISITNTTAGSAQVANAVVTVKEELKAQDLSVHISTLNHPNHCIKYDPSTIIKSENIKPSPNTIDKLKLETGDYTVSHGAEQSFIKVVKQGNYLKLRREAQLIGDKLCFVCPHCSKVFHRSSNFSRHMRIHRGVYSYVCPTCQRGFFRKEHFQKHKCYRKGMSITYDRKTKMSQLEVKPPLLPAL